MGSETPKSHYLKSRYLRDQIHTNEFSVIYRKSPRPNTCKCIYLITLSSLLRLIPLFRHPPCLLLYPSLSLTPSNLRQPGTRDSLHAILAPLGNMTFLEWSDHVHTPGLAYMEDMYVLSEIYYRLIKDIMQPPELSEAIANASVQMLEHNGHYLRAKLMAEQQATEIARLQEAISVQAKENNDLKVQNKTLKYVQSFSVFYLHIYAIYAA
jgi:hypothetical protein